DVLSDIAYAASVRYRREKNYSSMRQWEEQSISLLKQSEPAATYLRNRESNGACRADQLFLSRPAVLLAICRQLERDRNYRPREASIQAATALEATEGISVPLEELCYLRGDLALSGAVGHGHVGDFERSDQLLGTARTLFRQTSFPAAL